MTTTTRELSRTVEMPRVTEDVLRTEGYTETELAYYMWCAAVSHLGEDDEVEELRATDLRTTQEMPVLTMAELVRSAA